MPELALQVADMCADGGLGQAQVIGGRCETTEPGGCFEASEPHQIWKTGHLFIDKKIIGMSIYLFVFLFVLGQESFPPSELAL